MKNSIPLWVKFLGMGHGAWGMGHGEEITNDMMFRELQKINYAKL
ncbi:hypothetical protein [Calothrix anomala]